MMENFEKLEIHHFHCPVKHMRNGVGRRDQKSDHLSSIIITSTVLSCQL